MSHTANGNMLKISKFDDFFLKLICTFLMLS